MPGFTFPSADNTPRFVDTGQGPVGRILSWMAWTADANPLPAPEDTLILRTDDNGAATGNPTIPLGQGGCGAWQPILDGFSNGATSGGDNCFFIDPFIPGSGLINDGSVLLVDDTSWPTTSGGLPGSVWSNQGVVNVVTGYVYNPGVPAMVFGDVTSTQLLNTGAFGIGTAIPPAGSGLLYLVGEEIWVA